MPESPIEDIFAELMPRIRNDVEVRSYLREFGQGSGYRQDLRCVLAAAPLAHGVDAQEPAENACAVFEQEFTTRNSRASAGTFSDQYYQLARYPLCNRQGILRANALQIQDVTAQVRDEKNKAALLSSVSHELRTPLTTIKAGVTGLLQAEFDWDEQTRQEILEEINAEADHLDALVNGLVEMSRIEMGALVLDKEWCDIVEVAHSALMRLERVLAGRVLRTKLPANLPLVYADFAHLERVFTHLIEYAAAHSPADSEIDVEIDGGYGAGNAELVCVKIAGEGFGVSPAERERIFRAFYGLNLHGSGLGLAIARGIIEAHEGQIHMEAMPGEEGSSVIFSLPTRGSHSSSLHSTARDSQFIASTEEQ